MLEHITEEQVMASGVVSAPDKLTGNPRENKLIFDKLVAAVVVPAFNAIVDKINEMSLDTMRIDQKFVPLREEWEDYADAMAANVASYLCNMAPGTTDCVVGSPVQDTPFVAIYEDNNSILYANLLRYDAVVDGVSTFGHYETTNWPPAVVKGEDGQIRHDAVSIDGTTYPILYSACSNFVTLLTKNRDYLNSPWYQLFTNPDATTKQLASYCLEKGDTNESEWSFDCLNVMNSWRMAEILRSSGCTPFPVAGKSEESAASYNAENLRKLRDGDILFNGNVEKYPDRYKGIYHCMMYFRDLDRLNKAAKAWGDDVTLRAMDEDEYSGDYGYIVHCNVSSDGKTRGTQNALRIETLDSMMKKAQNGMIMWGVRVSSNALNSTKLHQSATGRMMLYDSILTSSYRHNTDFDTISYNHVESMRTGTQNGFFGYGQFRYSQAYDIASPGETLDFNDYVGSKNAGVYCLWDTGINLVNGPTSGNVTPGSATMTNPTVAMFIFEVIDVTVSGRYTLQRISTVSASAPRTWERVINYQAKPGLWREMCSVTAATELVTRVCPKQTASGSSAVFDDGADRLPLKSLTSEIPLFQSGIGTPSPDNVRPFLRLTAFTSRRDDGADGTGLNGKTDLTTDGEPVYYCGTIEQVSGKLSLTKRMVTLTGADFTGRSSTNVSGKYRFYTSKFSAADKDASLNESKFPVCDRLPSVSSVDNKNNTDGICMLGSEQRIYVYMDSMSGYTLAEFKAWVDANPLTVFYTVSEPETVTVQSKTLTTLYGNNSVTARVGTEDGKTTYLDNVTVTYCADPALYIDKKLDAIPIYRGEVEYL